MRRLGIPKTRQELRYRRHLRIRNRVEGSGDRPRLVIFRSLKHIYAQLVDDAAKRTILSVGDGDVTGKKSEKATAVGKKLAEAAKAAGFSKVVFDRAGYRYHGRVKALADGAREGGLEF
ncbi:MAG: 50S ribosomal protein L18 [Gemmatimonadaceae bacterium]